MSYVVAIKPSARRHSAGAGEFVARRGARRTFESKALAREWARDLRPSGDGSVWIQDAAPNDPADVDGYLVAARRRREGGERGTQAELRID
ncbi:hypothetical protein BRC94_06655 [Halobacteriales archaeon QS_5_70_17]|nr:MAG: hypothetical protein BRC94_06655 [Halobacteriales archaeon QS_5_70_17]